MEKIKKQEENKKMIRGRKGKNKNKVEVKITIIYVPWNVR